MHESRTRYDSPALDASPLTSIDSSCDGTGAQGATVGPASSASTAASLSTGPVEVVIPGGLFGLGDFFLRRRRLHDARCVQPSTVLALSHAVLQRLQSSDPSLAFAVRDVLDRSLAMAADSLYLRAVRE